MNSSRIASSRQCAVWALQCRAILSTLTASDPTATGYHTHAVDTLAEDAWDAFVGTTLTLHSQEIEELWTEACSATEAATNTLFAYVHQRNSTES